MHKATYPTAFVSWFIGNFCNDSDTVFDPFLGSGTTMVAAEQLGRICYGLEISAAYCGVILQRMKDMGLEPRLAD